MNIFFLSRDPKRAASYHGDKHVVKMILESAQLLYCAVWILMPLLIEEAPENKRGSKGYRLTHKMHPCSVWARQSLENYRWLCKMALALCSEYEKRYGKTHSTKAHLLWLSHVSSKLTFSSRGFTDPPLAADDTTKTLAVSRGWDIVKSYRFYYTTAKKDLLSYRTRLIPAFAIQVLPFEENHKRIGLI